jgi:hypothetical protein
MKTQDKEFMEEKNEEKEYLKEVLSLVDRMIELSNKGIREVGNTKYLVLCGMIRDCAFKIKKLIIKED